MTLSAAEGGVLRRHLDPNVPASRPRPERLCRASRTTHYKEAS